MALGLTVSLASLVLAPSSALADPASSQCLDQTYARQLIQHFQIDIASFDSSDAQLPTDLCNPASQAYKIVETYAMINAGQFRPYRSGVVTEPYSKFVKRLSPSVSSDTRNRCGTGALIGACHDLRPGTISIRDHFFSFPTFDRVSMIIHESHHGTGSDHVTCTRGAKRGMPRSCDTTFSAKGAYAAGTEYVARVALLGTNFDPVTQATARAAAIFSLDNNFNQPLTGDAAATLLMLNEGGSSVTKWDGRSAPQTVQLGERGSLAISFLKDSSRTLLFLTHSRDDDTNAMDLGQPFTTENVISGEAGARLLSEFGITSSNLEQFIEAATFGDQVYQLFDFGIAVRNLHLSSAFIQAPSTLRFTQLVEGSPCGEEGVFVLASQGSGGRAARGSQTTLHRINGTTLEPTQCTWPTEVQSMARFGNTHYAVDTQGRLSVWNPSTRTLSPVPQFEGQRFMDLRTGVISRGLIGYTGE